MLTKITKLNFLSSLSSSRHLLIANNRSVNDELLKWQFFQKKNKIRVNLWGIIEADLYENFKLKNSNYLHIVDITTSNTVITYSQFKADVFCYLLFEKRLGTT